MSRQGLRRWIPVWAGPQGGPCLTLRHGLVTPHQQRHLQRAPLSAALAQTHFTSACVGLTILKLFIPLFMSGAADEAAQ